jgi:hypothetical protein
MADTLGYYYPRLRMLAPGCPEMFMGDAVLRAMATIARETSALRIEDTETFVSGTATYAFPNDGFRILDFKRVWFINDTTESTRPDEDTIEIPRKPRADMLVWNTGTDETSSRPDCYSITAPGTITLYPPTLAPSLDDPGLRVLLEVIPVRPAAEGSVIDPDTAHWGNRDFFYIAEETILTLAAGYILEVPNKPWSNRSAAGDYMSQAAYGIGTLKSLADDDMRGGIPRAVKYGGY